MVYQCVHAKFKVLVSVEMSVGPKLDICQKCWKEIL